MSYFVTVEISKDGGLNWESKKINLHQNDMQFSKIQHGDMIRHKNKKYYIETIDGEIWIKEEGKDYYAPLHHLDI